MSSTSSLQAPPPPPGSTLPKALQREFHEVIRMYDSRNWRGCLKLADKLLKACKEPHGETLAFRAMALYYLNRKAEGMQVMKDGLRASQLRSALTWWLMGVMHRTNGSAPDAIKAYRNALRLEPEHKGAVLGAVERRRSGERHGSCRGQKGRNGVGDASE
jgi:peptide alpha-N-acetyltransferase